MAPGYASAVAGVVGNQALTKDVRSRSGSKGAKIGQQINGHFDSDNDILDHESEFASEEDGDFR